MGKVLKSVAAAIKPFFAFRRQYIVACTILDLFKLKMDF